MGFFKSLVTSVLALTSLVSAASLQPVSNFGSNPSGAKMYIYVPDNLKANPSIIVAIHYCTGTAQAYYQGTKYAQLASQYNYIVIYPESPYSGTCWDVSSKATLTHNGGGNSNAIANMVTYTIQKYNADANRVYVTGSSSGAMMTNVLAATYPEMFRAGSVYNGVPAGCFYTGTTNGWNSTCSQGKSIHSQQDWANTARAMYPGYSGSYPRMLIYHGDVDTTLAFPNYAETIKQWSGIFGYSTSPKQTLTNDPSSPYTKYIYGQNLVGIVGHNIGHTVPVHETEDLEWFGFIPANWVTTTVPGGSPPTTSTKPPTTSTSKPATTTTSSGGSGPGGCTVAQWGQCGGSGYTGCTTCASGTTCKYSNDWYSQCL